MTGVTASAPEIPTDDAKQADATDRIVNSILRKPAEKRPASGQIMEVTEASLKRKRLDDLEQTFHELIKANEVFQAKCYEYRQQKATIDFINTPNFLKYK